MNSLYLKSFSNELQKTAAVGLIGDILTGSLLTDLAVSAAHHIKGYREAVRAGATLKEAMKYHPLPIGKEWKFNPLTPTNRELQINLGGIHTPFSMEDLKKYQFHLDKQKMLAKTLGMPIGGMFGIMDSKQPENRYYA